MLEVSVRSLDVESLAMTPGAVKPPFSSLNLCNDSGPRRGRALDTVAKASYALGPVCRLC